MRVSAGVDCVQLASSSWRTTRTIEQSDASCRGRASAPPDEARSCGVRAPLGRSDRTQWHHHTEVRDRFLVVRGVLTVETKTADRIVGTAVCDHYTVEPGALHHVRNDTIDDVVYIMVQSGGARDIVLA